MKTILFSVFTILFCPILSAQGTFADTFPGAFLGQHWGGDTLRFAVNANGRLQLQDTTGGIAWIFTRAPTGDSAIWEGYVHLDFSPSSSNRVRIFLAASHEDPGIEGFHGYYLQIGITGQDDRLELWRLDKSGSQTLLLEGVPGSAAQHPEVRYRVIRRPSGEWILEADYEGGAVYVTVDTGLDSTYKNLEYFAIQCMYTATRSAHFFFDDIFISPLSQDTVPPKLTNLALGGENRLLVTFNEAIQKASVADPEAWEIDKAEVIHAEQVSPEQVALLCSSLERGETYILTISNLQDRSGNVIAAHEEPFVYYPLRHPAPWDVLINEIYADPDTTRVSNGLPNAEWVEIINRSDDALQLEGVRFSDNGSSCSLPAIVLLPDSLVVICATKDTGYFAPLPSPVLGLDDFPQLNNDGETLSIQDSSGRMLHSVAYDRSWYGSSQKDDGGYSLELIAPRQPCRGSENWLASTAPLGGTPGRRNSVYDETQDEGGPLLVSASPISEHNIKLIFSEALNLSIHEDPDHFTVDHYDVLAASGDPYQPDRIMLTLDNPLEPSVICTLRVLNATDCLGNTRSGDTAIIAWPSTPEHGDIVLNELLFDPQVGGKDFVEFLNCSDKVIQMADLTLSNGEQMAALTTPFLLFPGHLVAYTEDPTDISSRYHCPAPERLLENDLPTFGPDTGTALLLAVRYPDTAIEVIDSVKYDRDYHHPLLSIRKGVSLERLGPHLSSSSPHTWHSAAENWGFATPTGYNSHSGTTPSKIDSSAFFSLEYKTSSPDGDGYRDQLRINYFCERPGYLLRAVAFDVVGRPVAVISNNESLGQYGIITWDGVMGRGRGIDSGIYVILMEAHHPDGNVVRQRLTAVVAIPWQ